MMSFGFISVVVFTFSTFLYKYLLKSTILSLSIISLGFSIPKSHWLKSTRRISTSNPNHQEYNFTIEQKIKEYDNVNKKYGVVKIGKMNVFEDLDKKIKGMIGRQYYTSKRYRTLYLHLEKFWGKLDLNYYEIDNRKVHSVRERILYLNDDIDNSAFKEAKKIIEKYKLN